MSRVEKNLELSDEKFKRRIVTTKAVFRIMFGNANDVVFFLRAFCGRMDNEVVAENVVTENVKSVHPS